jgi:hypothetical protein
VFGGSPSEYSLRRDVVTMIVTTCPSCGYAPLQRCEINRCIALLVRRSRLRFFATQMSYTRSGIPADQPVTSPKRSNSSHAVAPTTGSNPTWPADLLQPLSFRRTAKAAQSATLMEFLPLRRVSPSESTPRRFATPTTFRPQGFSPSRRFAPRSNAQPCFMLVTPMGFALQGFSLAVRSLRLITSEITLLAFLLRNAQ